MPSVVIHILALLFSLVVVFEDVGAHDHHQKTPHRATTNPLIAKTCRTAPFPDICLFALSTGYPLPRELDTKCLARFAVEGAIKKATVVDTDITDLLDRYRRSLTLQQCILDCSGNYAQATSLLQSALEGLVVPSGDQYACNMIDAAAQEANKCGFGCRKESLEKKLLAKRNDEFGKFCLNAKTIILKLGPFS